MQSVPKRHSYSSSSCKYLFSKLKSVPKDRNLYQNPSQFCLFIMMILIIQTHDLSQNIRFIFVHLADTYFFQNYPFVIRIIQNQIYTKTSELFLFILHILVFFKITVCNTYYSKPQSIPKNHSYSWPSCRYLFLSSKLPFVIINNQNHNLYPNIRAILVHLADTYIFQNHNLYQNIRAMLFHLANTFLSKLQFVILFI